MTERSIFLRLKVQDADKAIRALNNVGVRGERALGKIERASKPVSRGLLAVDKASGELQGRARGLAASLGPVGSVLSSLGPAGLAAAAGVGAAALGLRALFRGTRQAIEFADEIGKTADGIGIATGALQEYRFAAQIAGVETQTIDGAFQAFGKRLGELKTGTGTLNTFLSKLDEELKQQIIRAPDTAAALELIFNAMAAMTDQSQRAAFAAAAFGRTAGVRMVNLVREGADGLRAMRQEARDLGIVLEEDLIRNAEAMNDRLTIASNTIDANLNRALLAASPPLVLMSELFADIVQSASNLAVALGLLGSDRLAELREKVGGINEEMAKLRAIQADNPSIVIERRINDLLKERAELLRQIRLLEGPRERPKPGGAPGGDTGPSTADKTAARQAAANKALVEQLQFERAQLDKVARQRAIDTTLRRLNAQATDAQRAEVTRLAGELFDEAQTAEKATEAARDKARAEAEADAFVASLATSEERLNAELARARELYEQGALSAEEFARVQERLRNGIDETADAMGELDRVGAEIGHTLASGFIDAATSAESLTDALGSVERGILNIGNRLVEEALADQFRDLFGSFGGGGGNLAAIARADIAANPGIFGSSGGGGIFSSLASSVGSFLGSFFHAGGRVGRDGRRAAVPAAAFVGAPHLQRGTLPGLKPGEIAAILHRDEEVLNRDQARAVRTSSAEAGHRTTFGDVSIVVDGGGFGGDPVFAGEQIAVSFMDRLAALERVR